MNYIQILLPLTIGILLTVGARKIPVTDDPKSIRRRSLVRWAGILHLVLAGVYLVILLAK
ncbi:hypothetical protein [uncultured Chitinophaga sp.]|uniref:hypothetical protein n=1 Tax=uncultured Chitinophaga sp. TaxID=339340 RepID=UPI0025D483DE|nr:hypothetical protein [uncultured Chitinophaga sp.]